jgi:hypothetical protein
MYTSQLTAQVALEELSRIIRLRPPFEPYQPIAITPEDSDRLVVEGRELRKGVDAAVERMHSPTVLIQRQLLEQLYEAKAAAEKRAAEESQAATRLGATTDKLSEALSTARRELERARAVLLAVADDSGNTRWSRDAALAVLASAPEEATKP